MNKKVLVLMSGGVDSSLAAYLLKKAGYEVIGCTMRLFLCHKKSTEKRCCSPEDIIIAKRTAAQFGIKHYVMDKRKIFGKYVIENFVSEYLKGRTPNPCIVCNTKIKFEQMFKFARGLGCDFLATGHYAKIERQSEVPRFERGKLRPKLEVKYLLKKGIDETKDQSYFLYGLTQKNLPHILFPLGDYRKTEIRKLAKKLKLKVAEKKESQEICFVENADYRRFLEAQITQMTRTVIARNPTGMTEQSPIGSIGDCHDPDRSGSRNNNLFKPGDIVNTSGKILGTHKGLPFYTVGQRRGLGSAVGEPVYVVKINVEKNEIVAGKKEELFSKKFLVENVSWTISPPKKSPITVNVRIRYRHKEARAKIYLARSCMQELGLMKNNTAKIVFYKPQLSITPGQSAVFYKKDVVLGGGIIKEVKNSTEKASVRCYQ